MLNLVVSALGFAAVVSADDVCPTVTGTANKRCKRCIGEEPWVSAGCQFDGATNQCVASGAEDPLTDPADCPALGFKKGDCSRIQRNSGCRLNDNCGWNRVTEKCVPNEEKPCDQFLYNGNCQNDVMAPHCRWQAGKCYPKAEALCSAYERSRQCTDNGCTWTGTARNGDCSDPVEA